MGRHHGTLPLMSGGQTRSIDIDIIEGMGPRWHLISDIVTAISSFSVRELDDR